MRTTRFELHILPMIRQIDRVHMLSIGNFDLWDYATIANPAMANEILNNLQADPADVMPPQSHGGPWPEEWINVFQRWANEGFPRLSLATANQFSATRNGGVVTVSIDGTALQNNQTVWIDRYFGPQHADFVLYQDSIDAGVGAQNFPITELFEVMPSVVTINILDASGIHAVSIS